MTLKQASNILKRYHTKRQVDYLIKYHEGYKLACLVKRYVLDEQ